MKYFQENTSKKLTIIFTWQQKMYLLFLCFGHISKKKNNFQEMISKLEGKNRSIKYSITEKKNRNSEGTQRFHSNYANKPQQRRNISAKKLIS